jgi:Lon protease-like protein
MMFDIANADDMFGYIHTDKQGRMARVGTVCKVTDRQLLEDGRQLIALQGVGRFTINRVIKTTPYIVAEIEPDLCDEPVANEEVAESLEREVYDALKFYIRLIRCYPSYKDMVVAQATKDNRRTRKDCKKDPSIRRTDFSFSLANMIKMESVEESQLMLQTTDVMKRLTVEKDLLQQASELLGDELVEMGVLKVEQRELIRCTTFGDDYDEDILPADFIESNKKEEKDVWDISNVM